MSLSVPLSSRNLNTDSDTEAALLRHNKVLRLRQPLRKHVQALQEWMLRPSMGNVYLLGADRAVWSEPKMDDLVALEPEGQDDGFTSELTLRLISAYHFFIGRRIHVSILA